MKKLSAGAQCVSLLLAAIAIVGCNRPDDVPAPASQAAAAATQKGKIATGHIDFIEGYAAGFEKAKATAKPMMVFFTFDQCEYCHQMANEAFTQDAVVKLSERFVCVLVDLDKEAKVCADFRVRSFPTIQFLSPQGVPLNRVTGKQPSHEVVIEMQAALQAVARREAPDRTIQR